MSRLSKYLPRFGWRVYAIAALALAIVYLAALLAFFGKIGWSLLVVFGLALVIALVLLASQVAHIVLRGRS
ncbi:MAG: hypothetical protein F4Z80_09485 [Chloroflexi bacterium]|nr:hypothetical protein [Chloroflexota bacterium]MYC48059.1 hypothetical protein [Chloroflexota bacterium]